MKHTTTNVRFPATMYEKLKFAAFTMKISMSEFIRQAVQSKLDVIKKSKDEC